MLRKIRAAEVVKEVVKFDCHIGELKTTIVPQSMRGVPAGAWVSQRSHSSSILGYAQNGGRENN